MKKQISILLVEDDEVDVMAVKRAFELNSVTNPLAVCNNGEEALAYLRREGKYADLKLESLPNLILLDLKMPKMGGLEFLEKIKNDPDLRRIPVVILTTSNETNDVHTSYDLGIAGYLVKPVTFDKFGEAIKIFNFYWTLSELP